LLLQDLRSRLRRPPAGAELTTADIITSTITAAITTVAERRVEKQL
jgi:hypothetical protein